MKTSSPKQARRAVIFANGAFPDLPALRAQLQPDDYLIAADGGLRVIFALARRVDVLIGDLDSVTSVELGVAAGNGARIERYPVEKDETDLELAINYALKAGFTSLRIVAALGGRLDHTLGNLFLLQRADLAALDVRLEDGVEEVWLARGKAEIHGQAGERVSLLPLGAAVADVCTQGLRYPLRSETLHPQHTRGISNELLAETAQVDFSSGVLIIIHSRNTPGTTG